MAEPNAFFQWRDYVVLSERFDATQRQAIEYALDSIAAMRDGEGVALILNAAAAMRARDEHLQFSVFPHDNGSRTTEGGVAIDFDQLSRLRTMENGQERPISLTGLLVHELYHYAQPALAFERVSGHLAAAMMEKGYSKNQIIVARAQLESIADTRLPLSVLQALAGHGASAASTLEYLHSQGYGVVAAVFAKEGSGFFRSMLMQAGIVDADGVALDEQHATQFTDALMHKYFGAAEPMRGSYQNFHEKGSPWPLTLPRLNANVCYSPGYSEPSLGGLDAPVQVKPALDAPVCPGR